MADHHRHHHHQHRPNRISLPSRTTTTTTTTTVTTNSPHVHFPYPPTTPTPTPSKHRLTLKSSATTTTTSSLSFLFLLLFSLRSLYSLLPFLRSSPSSFSLFPFSFLVSLLSFLLSFSFSLFTTPSSPSPSKDPFHQKPHQPIFSLSSLSRSQFKLLLSKSLLLAVVFLLRFQALRYCGTAAMILAELSGNIAARFRRNLDHGSGKSHGLITLLLGLFMLSISWDRIECFPLSTINVSKSKFSILPSENCIRIWPMLLPFLSGFLGCYERVSFTGSIRELGQKRVRLITLFFTTLVLFIPALISMFVFESEGDSISIISLGWPLANTVVFGVLMSENSSNEKLSTSNDYQKEYLVTFLCTLVLELFYFPELSLGGLLICGFLLWIAGRELDPIQSGVELSFSIMKPIRHILSERKSRKIALFLLINTGYMVVEFVAGFMSNSLGLISDACHMLFDCAALAIGLYASYISRLPANNRFNYGRGRFEVLSGYVNAVFLVLVGALIVLESLERILEPQEISTSSLLVVSIGGLLVNIVGLIFFHEEHHHAHGGSSCSHSHDHVEKVVTLVKDGHSHGSHHGCNSSHAHVHDNHHECATEDHAHKHNRVTELVIEKKEHNSDHVHHHDNHHVCATGDHTHKHNRVTELVIEEKEHNSDHAHNHHECDHAHKHNRVTESVIKKKEHRHIDHNMEGIFLHVLADTMGSVGVVISTLLIKYKGWLIADPACSIFISILIVASVIPLLRNSAEVLLQRVPRAHEDDIKEAIDDIIKMKGVSGIQNFHVWSLTNSDVVGTIHLHVSNEIDKDEVKTRVMHLLNDAGIKDLNVQVECVKSN